MSAKVEKGEVWGWVWRCNEKHECPGDVSWNGAKVPDMGSRPTRDQARADAEAHNAEYHAEEAAA